MPQVREYDSIGIFTAAGYSLLFGIVSTLIVDVIVSHQCFACGCNVLKYVQTQKW
jgi:hypothetical protein